MPSTITHTYIGLDTVTKLNDNPKQIINKSINNYKVYCQSMDILYFYHLLLLFNNSIINLGHQFHYTNTLNSLLLLINDNKNNKDYELFTFISGLITHYIADSTMHPYINYLSYQQKEALKYNGHFEIETYLDNYFIKEKTPYNYKIYNNTKLVFNYTECSIINYEIEKLFQKIFSKKGMGKKYYRALKEMKFVFNYIRHDKYGIKKFLYTLIDLNPIKRIPRVKYLSYHFDLNNDNYYLNLDHNIWYNLNDKKFSSNKSFLDLYDDVTNESSYIINELYEYIFNEKKIDIKKLIKNNSYSTGLPLGPNK